MEIVDEFGIPYSNVVSIVTDNAANMIAATSELAAKHNWEPIRCAAHKLQLALNKGMAAGDVSSMIASVRQTVARFRRSALSKKILQDKCDAMNPDAKKAAELIMDVSTRWNSTYDMLQRVFDLQWELRAAISEVKETNKREGASITIHDTHWQLMARLVKVLKPFMEATNQLEKV